ncbi:hypothetical protein [Burkholderia multivorans]|uniref:Uncharacterized protein n=1 Tax=Burkholderia multivorans (strain ATCC 17616 / 249) TaxID=395019 RepID=A0A0H3KP36_BURM1|nr:hypothetical protein [Burkholderia multivorans]PRF62782.1 hypothetical protein C6Q28_08590 [Burkholderia multivorans]BAG47103.1 hypothetical protein BMULJ_05265 [Burkholderia multivorans ATCC 17616]
MKSKTTRLLRMLSDIRRAQRCTALRAARAAAEADAVLAQQGERATPGDNDETESDDPSVDPRTRIVQRH